MVLLVNSDIKMGKGKIAAQCCHAALKLYEQSKCSGILEPYMSGSHTKIVLKATEEELLKEWKNLKECCLLGSKIVDEGRTPANTLTVVAYWSEVTEVSKYKLL